jgi:hypothetical protein
VTSTANTDIALKISHHTMVRFGRQRSANVPPIKEKIKIGANSATDIKDTANGSPFVFSIMKRSTAKFLTHIPICKNNPEIIIA